MIQIRETSGGFEVEHPTDNQEITLIRFDYERYTEMIRYIDKVLSDLVPNIQKKFTV